MAKFDDLAERVDRLVLRHQELKRTTALIAEQLVAVTSERDSLRSRLSAARLRVDALLERLQKGALSKDEHVRYGMMIAEIKQLEQKLASDGQT